MWKARGTNNSLPTAARCARWHSKRSHHAERLLSMSERQKQADFLRSLLARNDCPEHRGLQDRLAAAESDERCLRRASRWIVVVALLALSVLGYLTVLEVADSMSRMAALAVRFAQSLALGSAMFAGVVIGLLAWQRALIRRLHTEARLLVTSQLVHQSRAAATVSTITVHDGDTAVYQTEAPTRTNAAAAVVPLSKAS